MSRRSNEAYQDAKNFTGEEDFLSIKRRFLTTLVLLPFELSYH